MQQDSVDQTPVFPGILAYRIGREKASAFLGGRSWLGGCPSLGDLEWPQNREGMPLYHLATIDMGDIDQTGAKTPLPRTGQLAFFADYRPDRIAGGRVIYVEKAGPSSVPEAIHQIPALLRDELIDPKNPFFARWPLAFSQMPADPAPNKGASIEVDRSVREVMEPFVEAIAGPRSPRSILGQRGYAKWMPCGENPWLWDTAFRFAETLEIHDDELSSQSKELQRRFDLFRNQAESPETDPKRRDYLQKHIRVCQFNIERFEIGKAEYRDFANGISNRVKHYGRWSLIEEPDLQWLKDCFSEINGGSVDAGRLPGRHHAIYASRRLNHCSMSQFADETFRFMLTAKQKIYSLLPERVRRDIETGHRLPPDRSSWHQLLGRPNDIQGTGAHQNNHLLLQLASDPILNMHFGDLGNIQYLITPKNLAKRKFNKAVVMIGGH